MKYLLVVDYAYYTEKLFFGDNIQFTTKEGVICAKLFTLSKFTERLNGKTLRYDLNYEIGILQLNLTLNG